LFARFWSYLKIKKILVEIIYFFLGIFTFKCWVWVKIVLAFTLIGLNVYLFNFVWLIIFWKYHIVGTILILNLIFTYSFGAGVKIYVINIHLGWFLCFVDSNFILFIQLVSAYFIHLKYRDLNVLIFLFFRLNIFRFVGRALAVIGLTRLLTLSYTSFALTLRRLTPFNFTIALNSSCFLGFFNKFNLQFFIWGFIF
jgi:hypothetical protein